MAMLRCPECDARMEDFEPTARMEELPAILLEHLRADHLTDAECFFYVHAVAVEQGRLGVARQYAAAEAWAKSVDLRFVWQQDEDGYMDAAANGEEFETCEWVAAYPASAFDDDRDMGFGPPQRHSVPLASLGNILNADSDWRRVIEAELAMEARDAVERADAHAKLIAPILEDLKTARAALDSVIAGTRRTENAPMPDEYFTAVQDASVLLRHVTIAFSKHLYAPKPVDETEECDECGASIPNDVDDARSMFNRYHEPSCSLHPSNTV